MRAKVFILLVIVLLASNLLGFDGKRKGFLLGCGIGFANVSYFQEYDGYESDTEVAQGLATDFKIGYAPNNKLEFSYSRKAGWITMENVNQEEVGILDGITTLSLSYFLSSELNKKEWIPSSYLSMGFGLSDWSAYEENSEEWVGMGWFVGGGYEFSKHYRVELNIFVNNPSTDYYGSTFTTNSMVVMLTFNAMAF